MEQWLRSCTKKCSTTSSCDKSLCDGGHVFTCCTHNVRSEWELNALLKAAYTLSSSIAPACGLIIHVFHVGASSIIVKCVLLLAVVRLAVVISPLPLFAGLAGRRVGFV